MASEVALRQRRTSLKLPFLWAPPAPGVGTWAWVPLPQRVVTPPKRPTAQRPPRCVIATKPPKPPSFRPSRLLLLRHRHQLLFLLPSSRLLYLRLPPLRLWPRPPLSPSPSSFLSLDPSFPRSPGYLLLSLLRRLSRLLRLPTFEPSAASCHLRDHDNRFERRESSTVYFNWIMR